MNITKNLSLGQFFTFESSKEKPIYNWFYYKEAFSPSIVEWVLEKNLINQKESSTMVLDPFCGVGTSILTAKMKGLNAIGIDASPVAVLASKVKCSNYSPTEIENLKSAIFSLPYSVPTIKWEFELFDPVIAFPRRNITSILSLRESISAITDEKIKNFLMLALLSIIPQCSLIVKDGGVLKIDKGKSAMPVKIAFRRKLKKMIQNLETVQINGPEPSVQLGDARRMMVDNNCIDMCITSPPYLNNVDYTKVYGLELSLLNMDKSITKKTRGESLRSFITSNVPPEKVPPEVGEIGYKIPVIGNYFSDMEKVLIEINRVLKPGGYCYIIIGNSVVHGIEIFVDELLGVISERLGMHTDLIIGAERIADVKPRKVNIRESIIIMEKQ